MSITLSSIRMAVLMVSEFLAIQAAVVFRRELTRFTEPRLQTAISSTEVLRVISVQRFDGELHLRAVADSGGYMLSLNVIQGWPVSNSIESIFRQMNLSPGHATCLISPLCYGSSLHILVAILKCETKVIVQIWAG